MRPFIYYFQRSVINDLQPAICYLHSEISRQTVLRFSSIYESDYKRFAPLRQAQGERFFIKYLHRFQQISPGHLLTLYGYFDCLWIRILVEWLLGIFRNCIFPCFLPDSITTDKLQFTELKIKPF